MALISQVTNTDPFSLRGQDCLIRYASTFYLIGVGVPSGLVNNAAIQVFKSTDEGATWAHLIYGPTVRVFGTTSQRAFEEIACTLNGSVVDIFYCSEGVNSSVTGLEGVLTKVTFNIGTETFGSVTSSNINPYSYTFNGSTYAVSSSTLDTSNLAARRVSDGSYRLIFSGERNTISNTGAWYTATFNGSFSSTVPVKESGNDVGLFVAAILDQNTDTYYTLFFEVSTSVPFLSILNADGSLNRIQDYSVGDLSSVAKFSYVLSNNLFFNWAYKLTSVDQASILAGAAAEELTSLTEDVADANLPSGNSYIQNPQTAIFNNVGNTCYSAFYFSKKIGATEMHLLRSFKVGASWQDYIIIATFSSASVSYDTTPILWNYVGLLYESTKFGFSAGGSFLFSFNGPVTPIATFPVYFGQSDITFHSSCSTVVNLSVQVSDTLNFADSISVPVLNTPGTGIIVTTCPDIIVNSAYCSTIKTSVDGETQINDCEESIYAETTEPCQETAMG